MNSTLKNLINKQKLEELKNAIEGKVDDRWENEKPILIIDFWNLFIRNFATLKFIDPATNLHVGGIFGSLQSLKYLVKLTFPDEIYVAYEGKDSSKRRKDINENYKKGRKKVNPFKEGEYDEDPSENMYRQLKTLKEFFDYLPFIQLEQPKLEADDIIAFLCKKNPNRKKIIVSSDKDFYQLLDENTRIFEPIQKRFITEQTILDKFGIHPKNFCLARTFDGDKSDNVDGLEGVGLKTVLKLFPFISENKRYSLEYLTNHAIEKLKEKKPKGMKKYELVIKEDSQKTLYDNFKIMDLFEDRPIMNEVNLMEFIKYKKEEVHYDPTNLRMLFIEHGANKQLSQMYDWDRAFTRFQG